MNNEIILLAKLKRLLRESKTIKVKIYIRVKIFVNSKCLCKLIEK